jgi:predicted ferric reductase
MSEAFNLSDRKSRTRPAGFQAGVVVAVIFATGGALLLVFWLFATGSQPVSGLADFLNVLGRLTGLAGTYLVLWQLVLLSRIPWLEDAIGMERGLRLHRLNAYASLGLIGAHAVFQTLGYMLGDGLGVIGQLADFINHYQGALMAIVALLLMLGVVAVSIGVPRRRLSYETWYFIHLYTYLAVALAFLHEVAIGSDFVNNPLFTAYWVLLYVAVACALVGFRVAMPLVRWWDHRFHVLETVQEASRVTSVYVGGWDLERFRFKPGQFMIWRFLDGRRWSQAHPFSLSAVPNGDYMRMTVRAAGDFSGAIAALRPGTPVLVEGPFGRFTLDSCHGDKALLIAGGIGITPLRPLAEEMALEGMDVCLLYRVTSGRDIAFRDELEDLSATLGVRIEYLVAAEVRRREPSNEWLKPHRLHRMVPDARERDAFVCGPPQMIQDAIRSLEAIGVETDRIHTEVFRY